LIAFAIDLSSQPAATMLWLSCATEEAIAPFLNPKFLIKAFATGAVLYRLTTTIFKISFQYRLLFHPF